MVEKIFAKIFCLLHGHQWREAAYVNPQYKVWICLKCGKIEMKEKGIHYYRKWRF